MHNDIITEHSWQRSLNLPEITLPPPHNSVFYRPDALPHSRTSAPAIHMHGHYINNHIVQEFLATAATKAMIDKTRVHV